MESIGGLRRKYTKNSNALVSQTIVDGASASHFHA